MAFLHYTPETPESVKIAKGLHLVTQSTANGQATQILLEELKQAYGLAWTTTVIDISTNEQKKDWYLRLNPNGRIPLLIDNRALPPFPIHETSAQLFYLARHFDTGHEFHFEDAREQSALEQWTFFWHGSGAPYQGNNGYFRRQAEQSTLAITRFRNETLRVFGVLELRLSGKYARSAREYLAGEGAGRYSVADIKTWAWVKNWHTGGFSEEDMAVFPHLLKWIDRVAARPAVQRGTGAEYASDGPNKLKV